MITRRELAIAGIAGAAVLVVGLIVAHVRDATRDAELQRLHGIITSDSTARVAAVAKTDTAIAHADTAVRVTQKAESGWAHARDVAARTPGILASSTPDTVKIRELVATVDTLRLAGDSLAQAAAADTVAIAKLRVAFAGERAAWKTERTDLSHALDVSEAARHRHWGLGCSVGPSGVRDPAGVIRGGLVGGTCGITYRW